MVFDSECVANVLRFCWTHVILVSRVAPMQMLLSGSQWAFRERGLLSTVIDFTEAAAYGAFWRFLWGVVWTWTDARVSCELSACVLLDGYAWSDALRQVSALTCL